MGNANWQGFYGGLQDIGTALSEQVKRKREQEEALQLLLFKAKTEAQYNPENQLLNYITGGNQPLVAGTPTTIPTTTTETSIEPVAKTPLINKEQLLRGLFSKKFGVPYEQMMTPEEKEKELGEKVREKEKLQQISEKELTAEQKNAIQATKNSITMMEEIEKKLSEKIDGKYKYLTGGTFPSYRYSTLPGAGYVMARKGTKEEASLNAQVRKLQAEFIKAQTGAQRGFKEMSFLLPALPMLDVQSNEMALNVLKSAKQDMKNYLTQMNILPTIEQQQNISNINEEDIQYTMQKHGLSREEVLKRLGR